MQVGKKQTKWDELFFYQKTKSIYAITYYFTQRFLQKGDRTIDQMLQAARSAKQNIVEGGNDGVTSVEIEIKLLNVAKGSLKELKEDYEDYLMTRNMPIWDKSHPRFDRLVAFCRVHNLPEDYIPLLDNKNAEEIANMAITLCHFVDKMMLSFMKIVEKDFLENGGVRERMTAARLQVRGEQQMLIQQLKMENQQLKNKIAELEEKLARIS